MEFKLEEKVRQYEVDTKNRMRPSVYIELMQEAAAQHSSLTGHDAWNMIERDKRTWIISRMNLEIKKQIPMYEKIEVNTWRTSGKAATYPRNYEISCNGEVCATGYGQWACIDIETGKLVKFNDFYNGKEFPYERIEMSLPDKFRVPPEIELHKASEIEVTRWMTDINGHMNNAKYIDPLWSALPHFDDCDVTGLSIHYMHECVIGDVLEILNSDPILQENGDYMVYQKVEVGGELRLQFRWILSPCQN